MANVTRGNITSRNFQTLLEEEKRLVLDQVSRTNDKGGASNDGDQAKRFFSLDYVDAIVACELIKYKETIKKLHQNLSVLLRVVSSTSDVDCEELNKLTIEKSLIIVRELT